MKKMRSFATRKEAAAKFFVGGRHEEEEEEVQLGEKKAASRCTTRTIYTQSRFKLCVCV